MTPKTSRTIQDQLSSTTSSSIQRDEGSQSPKGFLAVLAGVDGRAIGMITKPFTTEEVEVPKATLGEGTSAQIQVLKSSSKERVGIQSWAPEIVVFPPPAIPFSCPHSVVVRDIDSLSSSDLADLGAIFRVGPRDRSILRQMLPLCNPR